MIKLLNWLVNVSAVSITSSDTDNDHKWECIVKGHFNYFTPHQNF